MVRASVSIVSRPEFDFLVKSDQKT